MKASPLLLLLCLQAFTLPLLAQPSLKALLVTTTRGWHHESVHYGVVALKQLAEREHFTIDVLQDPNGFNDRTLKQYAVVVFLNTTGDIFDSTQQKVMERFIQSGKGYVGIHSASDTEYDWPWYRKLVGRMFRIHPPVQPARLQVLDKNVGGLKAFAGDSLWTDEWYEFSDEETPGLKYILSVDEASYNPKTNGGRRKAEGMGAFHPIAWYHNFDGGRSFYTALGHRPANYSQEALLQHLLAGIRWAAGQ